MEVVKYGGQSQCALLYDARVGNSLTGVAGPKYKGRLLMPHPHWHWPFHLPEHINREGVRAALALAAAMSAMLFLLS